MKILISDYDKTLFRTEDEVLKNIKCIKEFMKNNMFCIASGRSKQDIYPFIHKYNIPFNYLILNHGATLYDKNFNLIKYHLINDIIAEDIHKTIIEKAKKIKSIIYSIDNKDVKEFKQIIKLLYVLDNIEDTYRIKEIIDNKYDKYIKTYINESVDHVTLEIINKDRNKSIGIKEIVNIENVNYEDVIVVGDNYNDIEMIKDFNGYAINNSIEEIKNITSKRCGSVYDLIEIISK